MPRTKQAMCRKGLHRLDDPRNVYLIYDRYRDGYRRQCRPCVLDKRREARRRGSEERRAMPRVLPRYAQLEWTGPHKPLNPSSRWGRRKRTVQAFGLSGAPMAYRPTAQQLLYLQLLADGMTVVEVAERLYVTSNAVRNGTHELRCKYGVTSNAAAVAQGLKRGTIRPDRKTGKRLSRTTARRYLPSVRALVRGERGPYRAQSAALGRMLDALLSWSEPHAVSVLWGAGSLTARDVPQTRNRYRRRVKKRREDAATWKTATEN